MEPLSESEEEEKQPSLPAKKKSKFMKLREQIAEPILKSWEKEQMELVGKIKEFDDFAWTPKLKMPNTLRSIGGMDISFHPKNPENACAYFSVFTYPDLEIVYEDYDFVRMTIPYVPSFLAFREAPHLLRLYEKLKSSGKECMPQLIMFDGNGILHTKGCGLASHMGVILDIPTMGCSKTSFYVDGLTKDRVRKLCDESFESEGDYVRLVGNSGRIWGAAYKSTDNTKNPIFLSIGTKISLSTAIEVAQNVCYYRIPEPIRHSDLTSRQLVKKAKETDFP